MKLSHQRQTTDSQMYSEQIDYSFTVQTGRKVINLYAKALEDGL